MVVDKVTFTIIDGINGLLGSIIFSMEGQTCMNTSPSPRSYRLEKNRAQPQQQQRPVARPPARTPARMLDILYYSNFCAPSQKVLQHLVKNGMARKMNFICIDKRQRGDRDNQTYVLLDSGRRVPLPPNVHAVPALLLVKDNYRALFGEQDILRHFAPRFLAANRDAAGDGNLHLLADGRGGGGATRYVSGGGEPLGVALVASNHGMHIVSEQFTPYDLAPEDLAAKSSSARREMHSYFPASHDIAYQPIATPPDTYRPDKLAANVTVDSLEQQRVQDIRRSAAAAAPSIL